MSVLKLSSVTYNYRGANAPAVNDVNCVFEPGKLYAVVGPSGSGKSTLLSLLAGLDLPTGGSISFDGMNIATIDLDRYRRENVTMIFQAFHLFPLLTVTENVCYPMELRGIRPKDAKPHAVQMLERVGITQEQMRRFPSRLSGGEQQRVAIARCLATGAKTILADEPTGNLDTANTENVIDILHKLAHDENYCIVIVTHDLEVADKAEVVYKMRDGSLSA